MQVSLSLNIASFNVGTEGDWLGLHERAEWKVKKGRDIISSTELNVDRAALREFVTQEKITLEQAIDTHRQKIKAHLGHCLQEFKPDIICLQEYFYNPKSGNPHQSIKDILESSGYAIVGVESRPGRIDDKAIAYKRESFECLRTQTTFKGGEFEPACFADLKHRLTGIVIRAVSDHVPGFNGKSHKIHPGKVKSKTPMPTKFEERVKFFNRDDYTVSGDRALDLSLRNLEENTNKQADVIIYGLDANTTSKASSADKKHRLHPKRMRLFDMYKYLMDNSNNNPTIIDSNDADPKNMIMSALRVLTLV